MGDLEPSDYTSVTIGPRDFTSVEIEPAPAFMTEEQLFDPAYNIEDAPPMPRRTPPTTYSESLENRLLSAVRIFARLNSQSVAQSVIENGPVVAVAGIATVALSASSIITQIKNAGYALGLNKRVDYEGDEDALRDLNREIREYNSGIISHVPDVSMRKKRGEKGIIIYAKAELEKIKKELSPEFLRKKARKEGKLGDEELAILNLDRTGVSKPNNRNHEAPLAMSSSSIYSDRGSYIEDYSSIRTQYKKVGDMDPEGQKNVESVVADVMGSIRPAIGATPYDIENAEQILIDTLGKNQNIAKLMTSPAFVVDLNNKINNFKYSVFMKNLIINWRPSEWNRYKMNSRALGRAHLPEQIYTPSKYSAVGIRRY